MTRRRTAGTRTWLGVLRSWLGRGRTSEEDFEVLRRGGRLQMVAYLGEADRGRGVTVDLGPDPRPGCSIRDHLGEPPYRVCSTGARTLRGADPWAFTVVDGDSDHQGRSWTLAVPRADVPLLRAVLLAARAEAPPAA